MFNNIRQRYNKYFTIEDETYIIFKRNEKKHNKNNFPNVSKYPPKCILLHLGDYKRHVGRTVKRIISTFAAINKIIN